MSGLDIEIVVDPDEMPDARWFTRDEVKLALEDKLDGVSIPGPIAIAHHLIRAWAHGTANIWRFRIWR